MEKKYCRNCGCILEDGMQMCPNCHTYVGEAATVQYYQPVQEPKKSFWARLRVILLVSFSILFVFAACIGTFFYVRYLNKDDSKKDKKEEKEVTRTVKEEEPEITKVAEVTKEPIRTVSDTKAVEPAVRKLAPAPKNASFKAGDYSGVIVKGAIDSEGLTIPELEPGETLYIGYAEAKGIGLLKYAAVLSADGTRIRKMTTIEADFTSPFQGKTINFSSITREFKDGLAIPSTSDQAFWESTIKETELYEDVIYIKLHYVFKLMLENDEIEVGDLDIWMKKAGT